MLTAATTMAAVLIMAIGAFFLGFYMGKIIPKKKTPTVEFRELSPEEKMKTERTNREIKNMLSYDGTAQNDIDV